jgi:hypothetical protein
MLIFESFKQHYIKESGMVFIRYGGLSPLKQDHYTTSDDKSFHNPPKKRGVYAFPQGYVDKFLIGSTNEPNHVSGKSMWLKDKDGNKIKSEDFYEDSYNETIKPEWVKYLKKLDIKQKNISYITKDDESYVIVLKKPKVFTYNGNLWHHFVDEVDEKDKLEQKGSWIKTTMEVYIKAFNKHIHIKRGSNFDDVKYASPNNISHINPYKRVSGYIPFTKDRLEVFIEKI